VLRVLSLINSLGQGGAERSLLDLASSLKSGYDIAVDVAPMREVGHGFVREASDGPISLVELPRSWPLQVRAIRARLASGSYDLLWTTLYEADITGRIAAWRTAVPVLTSLVNTTYDPIRRSDPRVSFWKLNLARTLDGWSARHLTARFHAISATVAHHAVEHLGINPEKVTVIPRGRRPEDYGTPSPQNRAQLRSLLAVPDTAFLVVNVGRHEFQKGQRYLIDAVARLRDNGSHILLLIAGRTGHETLELQRQISRYHLHETVRLLGDRRDVGSLLGAADIFVFPSLYEGLGGSVIEAMAAGLPVVASDLPAVVEALGSTGVLVPPRDSVSLASAIKTLEGDPERRRLLAQAAQARFFDQFTLDRVVADTARLLSDAAARPA
jgi:glycosyltransferase involved in cell wall biosynthesis